MSRGAARVRSLPLRYPRSPPPSRSSARDGWSTDDLSKLAPAAPRGDMKHLLRVIERSVPPPRVLGGPDAPFRMLVTQARRRRRGD